MRKYTKCTKVEKQENKAQKEGIHLFKQYRDASSISSPAFVWKAALCTPNLSVDIPWPKNKMQNAKAAFFCLPGQVFFTTMTRFIFF